MKTVSMRRRPKRPASSLPSTLAGRPSVRITVAHRLIVLSPTAPAAANAMKATSQVRKPNSSQQWAP